MEFQGWNAWAEQYKPIKNTFKPRNELMFETYGDEFDFIQAQDRNHVWTGVQDGLTDLIVPGYAYMNRFGYYITEVPWEESEDVYVLLSVETECECYDEETGEGKEDCPICDGDGLKKKYLE